MEKLFNSYLSILYAELMTKKLFVCDEYLTTKLLETQSFKSRVMDQMRTNIVEEFSKSRTNTTYTLYFEHTTNKTARVGQHCDMQY